MRGPRAPRALVAHVAVTNGDGVWSARPAQLRPRRRRPLRFAFDDSDPGCPGCRGVGPQASAPLRERVREVWAAEPAGGPSAGGTRFVVRAVGYAGIIATKKNTDGVATEDEPESVAFRGASRPRGGPRTGGRADPDAGATKPHGTFYPSESLACRMECPLAFASAEARAAAPPRERFATSDASARFLTLGPGSVLARALHAQARHHAGLRRAEEGKSDAFSSSGFFRRVDVSARWIDYDAVECVSPPKPTVDAKFAARWDVAGVADDCRVAVTNDGVHFDDAFYGDYSSDGSSSDASARALANAARVAFAYSDAAPEIFSLETTHRNPALERRLGVTARGPFDGGAVVTVRGANFAVGSASALCRFGTNATVDDDQNKSPAADVPAWVVPALIVDEGTATCVSPRRTPRAFDRSSGRTVPVPGDGSSYDPPAYRPESSDLGSLWPCFVEPVAMSNDGGATWSPASDSARFLYCDVYVEPGGFGFETIGFGSRPFEGGGDRAGTPDAPFASVQSALDAALRAPTRREDAEPDRGASVFSKSAEEEATRSGSGGANYYYSAVGRSSRDVARGASGFKRTVGGREVSRIHPGTYATGFLESLGAWANVDVVRLAAGAVFGGEDDVELAAEGRAAKIGGSSGADLLSAPARRTRGSTVAIPNDGGTLPGALRGRQARDRGVEVGPEARAGRRRRRRAGRASAAEAVASAPSGLFFEGVDFVGCDAAAGAREAVPDRCDGWADRRDAESRAPFGGGGGGAPSSGGGGCRGDAHFVAGGSPGFAAAKKADAGADWAPFDYDDELGGWAPEDGWYDDAG